MTARRAQVLVTLLDPLTGQRIDIQAGHIDIPTDCPPRLSEVLDVLRALISRAETEIGFAGIVDNYHHTATEGDRP